MVQLLPEVPNFGTQFARSIGAGLGSGISKGTDFAMQVALEKAKAGFKKKEDERINKAKTMEGLGTSVDEMLALTEAPGIGLMGQLNPTDEARYNRGRMQSLKGELLNYYKTLFPRGLTQQEFVKLEKDYLPSSTDTVETMRGKLDSFKSLIQRKLEQQEPEEEAGKGKSKKGKAKFDIRNPEHKAKRDQVLKKVGGDREKAEKILSREFE